jgi:hypothetical protein
MRGPGVGYISNARMEPMMGKYVTDYNSFLSAPQITPVLVFGDQGEERKEEKIPRDEEPEEEGTPGVNCKPEDLAT